MEHLCVSVSSALCFIRDDGWGNDSGFNSQLKERKVVGFKDMNSSHKHSASYPLTFPYCRSKNNFLTCQNSPGDVFLSGICFFHPRSLNSNLIIHITHHQMFFFFHSYKMNFLLMCWICCCGCRVMHRSSVGWGFYFEEPTSVFLPCYFHTWAFFLGESSVLFSSSCKDTVFLFLFLLSFLMTESILRTHIYHIYNIIEFCVKKDELWNAIFLKTKSSWSLFIFIILKLHIQMWHMELHNPSTILKEFSNMKANP